MDLTQLKANGLSIAKIVILDLEMTADGNDDGDGEGIGLDGHGRPQRRLLWFVGLIKRG